MKKILALILALVCTLSLFAACGGEEDKTDSKADSKVESTADSKAESKDYAAIMTSLKADVTAKLTIEAFTWPEAAAFDDAGVDPESYNAGFWLIDANALSAEQVAVYQATDAAKGETIRTQLKNKLESLTAQYKSYNQDNYNMALKAVVGGSGEMAYLIISPNVTEVEAIVKAAID